MPRHSQTAPPFSGSTNGRTRDRRWRCRYTRISCALVAIVLALSLTPSVAAPPTLNRYLFCFWNVENLFDDSDDTRNSTDEEYDNPFAHDSHLRKLKLDRIASALVKMNDGRGPDVIACVEVESVRAAELLRDALNAKLRDPKLHYSHVEMKNLTDAGRHIAPCLITRLEVDPAKTRLIGRQIRILETHLTANGADLCVIVSHWTSQISQRGDAIDTRTGRGKYAADIYDTFAAIARRNPAADVLVCGDFNDTPDAEVVTNVLGAFGDRAKVTRKGERPCLLDLMAGKSAERFGTIWYDGRPLVYDQICVSAGMFDGKGWSCDPDSVRTATDGLLRPGSTRRQPWRFGNPTPAVKDADRGFSDHFPVTVELQVAP